MDIVKLKPQIESITDTSSIYLIESLNESAGFFVNQTRLLYMAKDVYGYQYEGIETDYLKLQTHVRISSVKNNQTFDDDDYNIIVYKGNLDDSNIASFIQLCSIYAKNSNGINFKEFFYSLITLFQLPTQTTFKNAVGLYGELKFMQYVKERKNIDISNSWHRNGSNSQYDFSNGESSIEIKTTLSDNLDVSIKHQQIFEDYPCTLVVINCAQYENGETIEEVIDAMYFDPVSFNGINFSINLAKELKRVSINDRKEIRFGVKDILFFATKDINPFPIVPDTVSGLSYKLDISEIIPLAEKEIDAVIDAF